MKIKDIIKSTKGKLVGIIDENDTYRKIKIDSNEVKENDIFVAIVGENNDGHNYINEAIKNKAKLIITSRKVNSKIPYIIVKDTTVALSNIAKAYLKKYRPNVIAITGSVGKTTTRNILLKLLKTKYNTVANKKNYNNKIGVPLTIFNINENTEILILEIGMNHLKEISYLSKLVKPNVSAITNIGTSHIGYLENKENILKAKLEILDGMKEKILFVNGDDKLLRKIKNTKKSGFSKVNNLKGYDLKSSLYKSTFKIKYNEKEYKIDVPVQKHLTTNVMLAINIALYYKIDIKDIIKELKDYKAFDMRMNIIKTKNNTIINDCYNSSFESLTSILKIIKEEKKKKLLILGDIKELGNLSKEIHQSLKPYIDKIENKEVILVGKEMENLDVEAQHFKNYQETIEYLKAKKIKNKLILIKGSRGMKLENITNYLETI
ncbi:MAG: UDP-N-acetylmuramoyl-tripeptide--D-alanyl-D-alanine ligase [Bacilli bacterium]|nr:UDP-N-acetylmuramoyl-tripeptide--D-alanyl-D-alanine ligase [Bacilli bacterium]